MFKEDTRTGLPIKLTGQEKAALSKSQSRKEKRQERKATGKRTGGKPVRKLQTQRGMSLQTENEQETNKSPEKDDDSSSTSEEPISPSPKRQNQKNTPPATATRKSTRNRQATLATALGNPIPIAQKAVRNRLTTRKMQEPQSLKSLIQEMGFTENTPEYKACVQFIQAISPKHKPTTASDVIDLTPPTEAEDETTTYSS